MKNIWLAILHLIIKKNASIVCELNNHHQAAKSLKIEKVQVKENNILLNFWLPTCITKGTSERVFPLCEFQQNIFKTLFQDLCKLLLCSNKADGLGDVDCC